MLGTLQLVNVAADGQTFTALYRVANGVFALSFDGSEVVARLKGVSPEAVAERLLRSLLLERAAVRLRELVPEGK